MQAMLTDFNLSREPFHFENPIAAERFARLNRNQGPCVLWDIKDLVDLACEAEGRPERVAQYAPRSVFRPDMLIAPMERFLHKEKFQPNSSCFKKAVSQVRKKFGFDGIVKPLTVEESYETLLHEKEQHSAGLPTLGRKIDDVEALSRAKACLRGKCPPPNVIGHRGKDLQVARPINIPPFEWAIVEGMFYYPLFSIIRGDQGVYPIGDKTLHRARIKDFVSEEGFNWKFTFDFSGFDGSIGTQLIKTAFDILRDHLELTPHLQRVWERVQTVFATSPFIMPDGCCYSGRRGGVPSGSMFTQMIDTVVNAISIEYCLARLGMTDSRYLVYGDDSWILLRLESDPQQFMKTWALLAHELGLTINVNKSGFARPYEDLHFLGHYDLRRGRPLQESIDRLCYPERHTSTLFGKQGKLGKCHRIVSYIADTDGDAVKVLYRVLMAKWYNLPISVTDAGSAMKLFFWQDDPFGETTRNVRDLPGIMQLPDFHPARYGPQIYRIRARM